MADAASDAAIRIDPATNSVATRIPVGNQPIGIATAPGAVWVANHVDESVARIDTRTNRVSATVRLDAGAPERLAVAFGSLWVGIAYRQTVVRLALDTKRVLTSVPLPENGDSCGPLASDDRAIWIASRCLRPAVTRIDPRASAVVSTAERRSDSIARAVAVGLGAVWMTTTGRDGAFLARIDSERSTVAGTLRVAPPPAADDAQMTAGGGAIWIALRDRIVKVEPTGYGSSVR